MKKLKAMFKRKPSMTVKALMAHTLELQERLEASHRDNDALRARVSASEREKKILCDEIALLNMKLLEPPDPQLFVEWKNKVARLCEDKEILQRDVSFLRRQLASALEKVDEYQRSVTLSTYDEETARAALMQLRVMQMSAHGRTGYGVTAFIPNEVLEKVRNDSTQQALLRQTVAITLIQRALAGMWHLNSRGNISAVLFAPKGAAKEGICGAVFDADTNPHVELARSKANDPLVRHIEQTIIDAQAENRPPETKAIDLPREASSDL
jgi:hypothetical protein